MAKSSLPEMPAGPVLELYGQRKRFTVPVGLKCLLEELSREVLRMQPANIYEFLADYLDGKLDAHCKVQTHRRKSWEERRWSWDGPSILSDIELMEFLEEFHLTFTQATRDAIIIQAAYRGYKARKMVKERRASIQEQDEADLDIEFDGEDTYTVYDSNGKQTRFSASDVERILKNYKLSLNQANKYAVKIQKTFRGYRTRESFARHYPDLAMRLQAIDDSLMADDTEEGSEVNEGARTSTTASLDAMSLSAENADEHLHNKATTIQKAFRDYKARKEQKLKQQQQEKTNEYEGEGALEEDLGEDLETDGEGEDSSPSPIRSTSGSFKSSYQGDAEAADPLKGTTDENSREGKNSLGLDRFVSKGELEDTEALEGEEAGNTETEDEDTEDETGLGDPTPEDQSVEE